MGMALTTRMLTPETWDDFAALVEANNGVRGGCWCIGFHPEGIGHGREGNRDLKRGHVTRGTVHQVLVYDGEHRRCCGRGSTQRDQTGRRRRRRGLSGADRGEAPAAWRLPAYRTRGVVCAIRLHTGPQDREVAVGNARQCLTRRRDGTLDRRWPTAAAEGAGGSGSGGCSRFAPIGSV